MLPTPAIKGCYQLVLNSLYNQNHISLQNLKKKCYILKIYIVLGGKICQQSFVINNNYL